MTMVALSPPAAKRPSRQGRRLDHPYPLFGFRTGVYRLPMLNRQADIHGWLLRQSQRLPREAWPMRWQRCQQEQRSWFKEIWVVHLPRASRWLKPGSYVFDPLTDFLRIPGSPPSVVRDCYEQAFAELPRHRFVYLDLLWEPTPTGLELLSVAKLHTKLTQQEQRFNRRMRHDRLLIEAAQSRQQEMMQRLYGERALANQVRLAATPAEARRVLGLSSASLQQSLQTQVTELELAKYDPMIVFEEPALLERAGGHMPLGLVAHWD